jgi:hypothetical protein
MDLEQGVGHNDMPDAICNHFVKQLIQSLPTPANCSAEEGGSS